MKDPRHHAHHLLQVPLLAAALALSAPCLPAAVPPLVGYQAQIKVAGVPFTGTGQFKFAVVDRPTGASLWSNDGTSVNGAPPAALVTLQVKDGLFNVLLGDSTLANMLPLDPGVFANHPDTVLRAWFNDGANGWTQLADRPLASAPYAMSTEIPAASITWKEIDINTVQPTNMAAVNAPQAGRFLRYESYDRFSWADISTVNNAWASANNGIYYNGGLVGIGTDTPSHRLSIAGGPSWTANGWQGALALENAAAIAWGANAAGQRFGMGHTGGGFYMFRTGSDPGDPWSPAVYDFAVNDSGYVGIGTLNPNRKLTVLAQSYGIEHTDGDVRMGTFVNSAGGWLGTVSNHRLNFFVNDGFESMTIDTRGRVGIGTVAPSAPLEVEGRDWNANTTPNISMTGSKPTVEWRKTAYNLRDYRWIAHFGDSAGLEFWYRSINQSTFPPEDSGWRKKATIGTDGSFEIAGNASVRSLVIRGGADLAEPFDLSCGTVAEGSVLVIDPSNPGKLRLSSGAYDKRVAGIVSGAHGVRSGLVLSQEGLLDHGQQVALTGRVYVRADVSNGPIEPGDLLTTSGAPGRAMKATDPQRTQGAVLGKAMTALADGSGMVLVLVTLQ